MSNDDTNALRDAALAYHEAGRPGKLEVRVTKPMATGRDLSLAYSPGVAEACTAIADEPLNAARFTGRQNLVAVVSNGTAVLGLGDIGPLASKPVMEGKAALFKKFAGVDCFDIEVAETDPAKLAAIVTALEPTFGAVNLEDIKAPECFEVERLCKERMGIPVFHDDQHGTAIVAAAAATNALHLSGRGFEDIKVVAVGGGAAGIACLTLFRTLGVKRENILVCDRKGVIHAGRNDLGPEKRGFAVETDARTLEDAIEGAHLFLGVSGPGLLTKEMVAKMGEKPMIFALANPNPEIMPDVAREARPDAMIATGRSDYANQVNNVLCFPFIFRGALDVGATEINDAMKIACVEAIAALARAPSTAETAQAYRGERLVFGPDYLIPKPFDPRLLGVIAPAVAKAAMESGVAARPLEDLDAYAERLNRTVYRSGFLMKPIFERARSGARKLVFAEGEEERALRAVHALSEEDGQRPPVLIGRRRVIADRIERLGLPIAEGREFELCDYEDDPRFGEYWRGYYDLTKRAGVTPDLARAIMRTNLTAIGALMVRRGEADCVICGLFGQYLWHLNYVGQVLARNGRRPIGALSAMVLDSGPIFMADTHVHPDPTSEQLVEITHAAVAELRRFGMTPKVAFISASSFGNLNTPSAERVRGAVAMLDAGGADFEYEGEMHVDSACDPEIRSRLFPESRLEGPANLLIMPNIDAASATKNALKSLAGGLEVGPILMGMKGAAHVVTPSISARGLLNVAMLAAGGEVGAAE